MTRKYNTKHYRVKSRYNGRNRLESLEDLRARQFARIRATCTIQHKHDTKNCNGSPVKM